MADEGSDIENRKNVQKKLKENKKKLPLPCMIQ